MEPLIIQPTERYLSVALVAETGKLVFEGRSLPEDGKLFFAPIITWLEKYALKPAERTLCIFKMEYFNSSSRKSIVDVFGILDSIREKGHAVSILWMYEKGDDELLEMGEEYKNLFELEFEFKEY